MQLLIISVVVCALLDNVQWTEGTTGDVYSIGTGRYDITGPAVEINLMGYAKSDQVGSGIHFRQYSRAFIIADSSNKRVVFISADIGMGTQIVKIEVVKKLQALYGSTYTDDNVLISGTHTHSGPAGFFQYALYEITSLGFVPQTFDAIVDGIVESVKRAHGNMRSGHLFLNSGNLLDASINRSPTAYLNNPASERAMYDYDTDKEMTVLKFVDMNGKEWGVIDWFAIHCTSMNNTNTLISGDNKGYASYLMEKDKNNGALPGQGDFVAAFAQANEGDTSPNTRGAHCIDTGLPCDNIQSTCNGKVQNCIASGPGNDMFDSTRIIGEKQYTKGKSLYESATTGLTGSVGYVHTHVDFGDTSLTVNGQQVRTCPPALGFSFAAGTTDGPGQFDFVQGDTSGNPFWALVRDIIAAPSQEQKKCHSPKPILLNTGDINFPYPWQPRILPLQLFRIGQLIIAGVPAEFTTMSGRRLKNAIKNTLVANGLSGNIHVVIAGLSNTYSGYVTTYEEYQVQRYEGASTVYGPYTLDAYLQGFKKLAAALAKGSTVDSGPAFPNYLDQQWSLQTGVIFDSVPFFRSFGDVTTDVRSTYTVGDTVVVEFKAGNPRNNLMTESTFLTVERKNNNRWTVVCTDASWETKFSWLRTSTIFGQSLVTVTWTIPSDVTPGTYRIQHFGHYKDFNLFTSSEIIPYSGTSSEFRVTA